LIPEGTTVALKTPQQYLESLKDGRVVYFDGELIPDVTDHPILKITNDWVATDYVLTNDPRYQDLLTDLDEDGDRVAFALQPQRRRRISCACVRSSSCGPGSPSVSPRAPSSSPRTASTP